MPTFRTAPSSSLTDSIRRLLASGGGAITPLQEIQVDQAAAESAKNTAIAEKARQEVEAAKRESEIHNDPALRTEFASHAAGLNLDAGNRLMAHIRGTLEEPSTADYDDAAIIGREAQPFRTAAPVLEPGQDRRFRSALAATMANLLAGGKTNAEQLTKASGNVQEQALTEAVQAAIARGDYQGASAISQGAKPGTAIKLHENIGTTGATFSPASGDVAASPAADPANALLASTIAESQAKAARERAAAELDRAKARNEGTPEARFGKPPPGYRWGPADEQGMPTLLSIAGGPAEKLSESQLKQVAGAQNTRSAIEEYRKALRKWSAVDIANPAARARMGTYYNNMLLQAKEGYNLGVLNGPDYMILQQVITNPASWAGGVTSKKALDDQAKQLSELMDRVSINVKATTRQREQGGAGAAQAGLPDGVKPLPATNSRGWRLMRDAAGNRAYVSPDGKQFEEAR